MVKNSIARILVVTASVTLVFVFLNTCYAGITERPYSIPCHKSSEVGVWYITEGKLDTQITLATEGVAVKGEKELVRNWGLRDGRVQVDAKCIDGGVDKKKMNGQGAKAMMYSEPDDDFVPEKMPFIECPKGKSLAVAMYEPTDDDPDTYVYKGILTETTD